MRITLGRFILALWLAAAAPLATAQVPNVLKTTPVSEHEAPADPLNRTNPRDTVYGFLQACQTGNYLRASEYLDLRRLPMRTRRRQGMEIALQLDELLARDAQFDIDRLSDNPAGDPHDVSQLDLELVSSFEVSGKKINVELRRVELQKSAPIWLFSAETVDEIPALHSLVGESEFEKKLPEPLVKTTLMGTALWRWLALLILLPLLGFIGRLLSHAAIWIVRTLMRSNERIDRFGLRALLGPIGLLLGVAAYSAGVTFVAPSALVRFYISRILTLLAFIATAWIISRTIDILARRVHILADPRQQSLYSSVLPLGIRVTRIVLFSIAVLATLSTWGYNTNTIWATLGVGSLAIALAAQKTLENFFGGVSVIGDRSVLVGDFCRVGDKVGTVEDIGLRSTRIRTLDRTLLTVPNSQFSTMALENFAKRDKMWFHPAFGIRCDATPDQIRTVMASFEQILKDHPEVEIGTVPVRFTGIATYSYTLEVFAYVLTPNFDRFLVVQSELLLKMLDAVEASGTGLAVPLYEVSGSAKLLEPAALPEAPADGASARS